MALTVTTPKKQKKVSFMMDASGFNFTASKEKPQLENNLSDDYHWNTFGSLSKSEFSFMSDRSSFAVSLNTLSDDSLWLVDPDLEKEQKLDFSKDENNNVQAFTFGTKNKPNYIQNNKRKTSVTSPSFSNRHSKSSHSITFSSTISLYTDTEKKQNSLLFYDLWGVPATETQSRAPADLESSTETEDNEFHTRQTSTSLSGLIASGDIGREQSTTITIMSDAIDEEDEDEWSDIDEDEEDEWDSESDIPQTQLISTKKKSTHKYRKRKSTMTDKFIFGRMSKVKK